MGTDTSVILGSHCMVTKKKKKKKKEVGVGELLSVEVSDKSAQVVLCSLPKDHTRLGLVKLVM